MTSPSPKGPTLKDRDQIAIQEKLQAEMAKHRLDYLILTECSAIYYATGHYSIFQSKANVPGYTIAVVPRSGKCTLLCPDYELQSARLLKNTLLCPVYVLQSARLLKNTLEIIPQPTGIFIDHYEDLGVDRTVLERPSTVDVGKAFSVALSIVGSSQRATRLGIQLGLLPHPVVDLLQKHSAATEFLDCGEVLQRARASKTTWEVDVLRTAAQNCESVMNATGRELHVGMTEAELMNIWAANCFACGPGVTGYSDGHSLGKLFAPTIVPREATLAAGDLVRFDTGPEYLGYISDIARVFSVGTASDEAKRLYDALAAGYQHALSIIGPGVNIARVFRESHEVVRRNGIPDYNRGHMGHSVGCHKLAEEWPYVSPRSDLRFEVGMVMSIEAPYNSPRIGGLCPEDTLVITESGFERFTHDPLQIVEV